MSHQTSHLIKFDNGWQAISGHHHYIASLLLHISSQLKCQESCQKVTVMQIMILKSFTFPFCKRNLSGFPSPLFTHSALFCLLAFKLLLKYILKSFLFYSNRLGELARVFDKVKWLSSKTISQLTTVSTHITEYYCTNISWKQ